MIVLQYPLWWYDWPALAQKWVEGRCSSAASTWVDGERAAKRGPSRPGLPRGLLRRGLVDINTTPDPVTAVLAHRDVENLLPLRRLVCQPARTKVRARRHGVPLARHAARVLSW